MALKTYMKCKLFHIDNPFQIVLFDRYKMAIEHLSDFKLNLICIFLNSTQNVPRLYISRKNLKVADI